MDNTTQYAALLKQAVEHHQAGRLQAAERFYLDILNACPAHPEANHNLGDLAVQMMQPEAGLPYFLAALEADPSRGQFWLSYIHALFQSGQLENARQMLELARQQGLQGEEVDALSYQLEGDANAEPLAEWIETYANSAEYTAQVERLGTPEGRMTCPGEAAMIHALIRHLRPKLCIEIGTFFAVTTRLMAEAVAECGSDARLITIDPFGGHRVPGIVQSWPSRLQAVVDFFPWNSMQLFVSFETEGMPKGAESSIGLIFVDGCHDFDYALFDILRSADHIRPNGAIVVDNLEQDGVRAALVQFMQWNPSWRLFFRGRIWDAAIRIEDIQLGDDDELWGVLISPCGIGVAGVSTKLVKRRIKYCPLKALRLNTLQQPLPGKLTVDVFYLAVPYDFSATGSGMVTRRIKEIREISGDEGPILIDFPEKIEFDADLSGMDISCEVTLSYTSSHQGAVLLLDANEPFSLIPDGGWLSILAQ